MSDPPQSENADAADWQLAEILAAIAEIDRGAAVSHQRVAEWLQSWGTPAVKKPPLS